MKEDRIQTLLLVAVLGMTGWTAYNKNAHRFVPMGDNLEIALDTQSGQTCYTVHAQAMPKDLPECKNLH